MKIKCYSFFLQIMAWTLALKACQSPLGMESGVIQSSQLSVGGGISYLPDMNKLRYNHPEGWCSIMITEGSFNPGRYIEIALKSDSKISALLLQKGNGKYGSYGYGDKIRLQWRDSKTSFFGYFKDRVGPDLKLKNGKNETEDRIDFDPPLCAQYIRILPFLSENHVCMRIELLGCSSCSKTEVTTKSTSKLVTTKESPSIVTSSSTSAIRTTNATLLTNQPARGSSKSITVLIIVIICVLCLAVVIGIVICGTRSKKWPACINANKAFAKKRPKKKRFGVKMETTFSEINPNDEPEKISLHCFSEPQETDNNYLENAYSSIYTAPLITQSNYTEVTTDDSPQISRFKKAGDEFANYSEPSTVNGSAQCVPKEPIYAGSQIYENPYQAVTGSSYYADPGLFTHKGPVNVPEFPRDKLRFVEKIGEGQFGEVHICEVENLCSLVDDAKKSTAFFGTSKVAVKLLRCGQDCSIAEEFMKESRVMSKLEHENVVQLIGVCLDEPKCMVVEYMENGDLMQFMQAHERYTGPPNPRISSIPNIVLRNDTLFYISMQVAAGMNYLSSHGFIHRDLATRNCLVGHSFTVKIADFGMSRHLYTKQYYRIEGRAILPIRWMAPESIYYGTFTTQTDIWSFGVTVWEIFMFASEQPYQSLSDQRVIENALSFVESPSGDFQYLLQPEGCPNHVYDLLVRCWNSVPEDRPTFQQLYDFFKALNPQSIEEHI